MLQQLSLTSSKCEISFWVHLHSNNGPFIIQRFEQGTWHGPLSELRLMRLYALSSKFEPYKKKKKKREFREARFCVVISRKDQEISHITVTSAQFMLCSHSYDTLLMKIILFFAIPTVLSKHFSTASTTTALQKFLHLNLKVMSQVPKAWSHLDPGALSSESGRGRFHIAFSSILCAPFKWEPVETALASRLGPLALLSEVLSAGSSNTDKHSPSLRYQVCGVRHRTRRQV